MLGPFHTFGSSPKRSLTTARALSDSASTSWSYRRRGITINQLLLLTVTHWAGYIWLIARQQASSAALEWPEVLAISCKVRWLALPIHWNWQQCFVFAYYSHITLWSWFLFSPPPPPTSPPPTTIVAKEMVWPPFRVVLSGEHWAC